MLKGYSDLTFVIGGSLGLSQEVKKSFYINELWVINSSSSVNASCFVEQIYRAFMIQEGSPYHK